MHKKINVTSILDVVVICIVGLAPLLWFDGSILKCEDINFPKNFSQLPYYLFSWDDTVNMGMPTFDYFPALLTFFFESIVSFFSDSILSAQKFLFTFWFTIPGLSFYIFFRHLIPKDKINRGALIGSIYYMTNIALFPIWKGYNLANISAYSFFPILFLLYIKIVDGKLSIVYGLIFYSVASFFLGIVGINPPMFLVVLIFLSIYPLFCSYNLYKSKNSKLILNVAKKSIFLILIFLLLNFYWVLPMSQYSGAIQSGEQEVSPEQTVSWLKGISRRSTLLNVLKLQGEWTWGESYGGDFYDPFSKVYLENPGYLFLGLLFPLLALCALFIVKENKYYTRFFLLTAFLSIFGGAGGHPPSGPLYIMLMKTLPLLWILRSPWYKFSFMTAFCYAFLLGIFVTNATCYKKVNKVICYLIPFVIIIGILIYSYPLLSGKMFVNAEDLKTLAGNRINIPNYVLEMSSYLKNHVGEKRVLSFPESETHMHSTNWGFYAFRPPISELTKVHIVSPNPQEQIVRETINFGLSHNRKWFSGMLDLLAIDYILYDSDLINQYSNNQIDHTDYKNFIEKMHGVNLEKKIGSLSLYNLNRDNKLASMSPEVLERSGDASFYPNVHYFNPPMNNIKGIEFVKKLSPTRFLVKITHPTPTPYLVFRQSYNSSWKAWIIKDSFQNMMSSLSTISSIALMFFKSNFLIPIPLENHMKGDGYANIWDLSNFNLKETSYILIEFKNQVFFEIGCVVSIVTMILIIIFIFIAIIKKDKISNLETDEMVAL